MSSITNTQRAAYEAAITAHETQTAWVCPRCTRPSDDFPALSRKDNVTPVCSSCGTDEAMRQFSGLDVWPTDKAWPFTY